MKDRTRPLLPFVGGLAVASIAWMLVADNRTPATESNSAVRGLDRHADGTPRDSTDGRSAAPRRAPADERVERPQDPPEVVEPSTPTLEPFDPLKVPEVAAIPDYVAPPGVDKRTEKLYEQLKFFLGYHIRNAGQQADPTELLKAIETKKAYLQLIREARYAYIGDWKPGVPVPEMNERPIDEHPDDRHEKYVSTGIDGLSVVFHLTRLEFPGAFNPR